MQRIACAFRAERANAASRYEASNQTTPGACRHAYAEEDHQADKKHGRCIFPRRPTPPNDQRGGERQCCKDWNSGLAHVDDCTKDRA
jgi:hypothetical protein